MKVKRTEDKMQRMKGKMLLEPALKNISLYIIMQVIHN